MDGWSSLSSRFLLFGHLIPIIADKNEAPENPGASSIWSGQCYGATLAKYISRLVGKAPYVFPGPVQVNAAILEVETIPL